jgi:DNA uptake protein ComE-like DNA-binding protein
MREQTTGTRSADLDLGWVDLNTISENDLAGIPWVGHPLAKEIIRHRPFMEMDDLRRVSGITEDVIDMLLRGGAMVGNPQP